MSELIEQLSAEVHNAWWEEKKKQGFHAPVECSVFPTSDTLELIRFKKRCANCHPDMYPYEELAENIKDYDRVMVRTCLSAIKNAGYDVTKKGEKDLSITEVRGAKANIKDLQVYGNGDTFALLCKASSQAQGWMKSTKVCNVPGGCVIQATTQQRNPDGSYAVAEALTYVPGVQIDLEAEPRKLVSCWEGK